MYIKKIRSDQFAGLHDIEKEFKPGLNVICGKNEAGKSTLVKILSDTLFTDSNIKLSSKDGKSFRTENFPSTKKDGSEGGNSIDGVVIINDGESDVTIAKKWGVKPTVSIKNKNGKYEDDIEKFNEIRKDILQYDGGVYNEIILSSQKNVNESLKKILESANDSKSAEEVLKKASMELGGIPISKIEEKIEERINLLCKKRDWWTEDFSKTKKKFADAGEDYKDSAFQAFNNLGKAKDVIDQLRELEENLYDAEEEYKEAKMDYDDVEENYKRFVRIKPKMDNYGLVKEDIKEREKNLKTLKEATDAYPQVKLDLEKACELKKELRCSRLSALSNALNNKNKLQCPKDEDISNAEKYENQINNNENCLKGMNIDAAIKMLGENKIEIRSVTTGESIGCEGGKVRIKEAVNIVIPDVAQICLAPAEVDAVTVKNETVELNEKLKGIFKRYGVDSASELRSMHEEYEDKKREFESLEEKFKFDFGDYAISELEEQSFENIRPSEKIEEDIKSLCKDLKIDIFIDRKKNIISDFNKNYGSVEEANKKIEDDEELLRNKKSECIDINEIPEEFRNKNPKDLFEKLERKKDEKNEKKEEKRDAIIRAENDYKKFVDSNPNAYENLEECERIWNEKHDELLRWVKIEKVFNECKADSVNTPAIKLVQSFGRYIEEIAGERITTNLPDSNRLNMNIYSGDNLIDFNKLSEGTKDTLSLAFRLAVLDYLFPDGGGIIVLDDPLTDMDYDRVEQSCKLIKKCSEKHQVIFLTCRQEYAEKLETTIIPI